MNRRMALLDAADTPADAKWTAPRAPTRAWYVYVADLMVALGLACIAGAVLLLSL